MGRGSEKDDYMTPMWLRHVVSMVSPIGLDPCAPVDPNHCFAECNYSLYGNGHDGLSRGWGTAGHGLVYCNPPYSKDDHGKGQLDAWCAKAVLEARLGQEIVMLLPGYLERGWWQKILYPAFDSCCYLKRRVDFVDPMTGRTVKNLGLFQMEIEEKPRKGGRTTTGWFPSVVVYLGDRAKVFESAFAGQGFFIRPIGR